MRFDLEQEIEKNICRDFLGEDLLEETFLSLSAL